MNFHQLAELFIENQQQTIGAVAMEELNNLSALIQSSEQVFLQGKGRTGLIMDMFAMRLVHLGFRAYIIGQPTTPKYASHDLLILASGSGATEGLLLTARQAQKANGNLFVITRQTDSPLAKMTQNRLIVPHPPIDQKDAVESKVLSGTLFEQALLLTLDCFCGLLAEQTGQDFDQMSDRHVVIE
jgi:6-phospho-3-hexuloisomerase